MDTHDFAREKRVVAHNISRARVLSLPATLTFDQWIATLNFFEWKCAYCSTNAYKLLEHFIPISIGGGTTRTNCVPACHPCNARKREYDPRARSQPQMLVGYERVHNYLKALGELIPIVPIPPAKVRVEKDPPKRIPSPQEIIMSYGSEENFWLVQQEIEKRVYAARGWKEPEEA